MPTDTSSSPPAPLPNLIQSRPPQPSGRVTTERTPDNARDRAIDHAQSPPEALLSPNASGPKRARWGWPIFLLVVVGAASAGWFYRDRWLPQVTQFWFPPASVKPAERVVPVIAVPAIKRDMNLYLNGLGTVTPLKTVVIRSRVDGQLMKVAFTEGQMVHEGDLLAEIDPRPFEAQRDQAAGQLARDEATLKTAKITLDRLQLLAKSEAVSTQEVDNQVAIVQQTEGMLLTDRAVIANAELQLTYCKIVSPINGIAGLRLVDLGNIVRANDPNGLVVINQVQPIALVFTISQDDIPRVQKRMREGNELQVDAYDRNFTTKLASGKLLATDNQVDSTTGTLRLKAIFDQKEATLFPNQFVNTRLLVDVKRDAIVIPSAAIQRGPSSNFVYVAKADDTVELRIVELGPSEGTETVIERGLAVGEQVVTDGLNTLDKLKPDAKISIHDPNKKEAESPKKTTSKSAPKQSPSVSANVAQ